MYGIHRLNACIFVAFIGLNQHYFQSIRRLFAFKTPAITPFLRAVLHAQFVRDQGDEFAVGGLFVGQRNTAAEGAVEGVNTAAAPGNLDGAVKKCKNEPLYGLHPYIYCVLHVYYSILLVWMQIAERGDRGDFRMGIYNLKPPLITAQ